MSRIAFRPTKDRLGGYCFSIDAIGHVEDERIADALKGLYRSSRMMIFLRFYQSVFTRGFTSLEEPSAVRAFSDEDYVAAEE